MTADLTLAALIVAAAMLTTAVLAKLLEQLHRTPPVEELAQVWRLTVTTHALQRAQERYDPTVTPALIAADVLDALRAGRSGSHAPGGYTARGEHATLHWTADRDRLYVVVNGGAGLRVQTALPPVDERWRTHLDARGRAFADAAHRNSKNGAS